MSKLRQLQVQQRIHLCPRLPSLVTALAYDIPHGHVIAEHMHPEDQLVYASRGVMTVRTVAGTWVVPAQRAVWIPAMTPHSIRMSGAVSMRTIYLRTNLVRHLPRQCSVLNVPPLLQELIVHLCSVANLSRRSRIQGHLNRRTYRSTGNCAERTFATTGAKRPTGCKGR